MHNGKELIAKGRSNVTSSRMQRLFVFSIKKKNLDSFAF